jgi:hypothetical protein
VLVHRGTFRVPLGLRQHDVGRAQLRRVWKRLPRDGTLLLEWNVLVDVRHGLDGVWSELRQRADRPDELRLLW